MKLLTTFNTLTSITSSGAGAGFPVANIADLDPMKRWVASAYAGDVWVKAAVGAGFTGAFLNRCNFPHCHIQWNATDVWTSPTINEAVTLVLDDCGNRKGWFAIPAGTASGYIRILIESGQTLDNSETLPAIGNLIIGTPTDIPYVAEFNPRVIQKWDRFESDGGGLARSKRGRARHVISMAFNDTLANIRALLKTWTMAVLFADLDNAGEAWLVYGPDSWDKPIASPLDASIGITLEERP
jgi:hypothetical protein